MRHCFSHTIQNEGIKGLYKGILPNFMKSVPAIAISYAVFEKSKKILSLVNSTN
jgi:solute carrier family 25 phosphate transporter 23/24/25/41